MTSYVTVQSVSGNKAVVEFGSGETKTAYVPKGLQGVVVYGDKAVVTQIGKSLFIENAY